MNKNLERKAQIKQKLRKSPSKGGIIDQIDQQFRTSNGESPKSQFFNYNGPIMAVSHQQQNQKFFLHSGKGTGGQIQFQVPVQLNLNNGHQMVRLKPQNLTVIDQDFLKFKSL